MSSDSGGDQVYYGQPVGPVDIVMAMRVNNPAADALRGVLMRYGAPAPASLPPPIAANGYYQDQQPPGYGASAPGIVQQQSLPAPR
jgi:hypothetical protein